MAYRLADRFKSEAEMLDWIDRPSPYAEGLWAWFSGIATGIVIGVALMMVCA